MGQTFTVIFLSQLARQF